MGVSAMVLEVYTAEKGEKFGTKPKGQGLMPDDILNARDFFIRHNQCYSRSSPFV